MFKTIREIENRSVLYIFKKYFSSSSSLFVKNIISNDDYKNAKSFEEIPGPKPIPFIGNMFRFLPYIGEYNMNEFPLVTKQLQEKYGNIVRLRLGVPGLNEMVFVYDPIDIENVFRNESIWPQRPFNPSLLHYRKVTRKEFFEGLGGVLMDQGKDWHDARTHINPVMMQPRIVNNYTTRINDVAEEFVSKLDEMRDEKNEMPENFKNEIHKWALESIAVIALDTRLGSLEKDLKSDSEGQKILDAVVITFICMQKLDMGPPIWKYYPTKTWKLFVKHLDIFREVCYKYVTTAIERINNGGSDDSVLGQLIKRDPNPKRAVIMALDMIAAGIDTTSTTFINVLIKLANNPEKQEKLYKELKSILPNANTPISTEALNEMKYLRACIKESLRLQTPTIGNARTTEKDIVLSNYHIPKKVDVLMPNTLISSHEQYYPKAKDYIPERWLRNKDDNPFSDYKINPFVTLPFGHGARKCVGMRFALLEIQILLAKIVRRYHLEWHYPPVKYLSNIFSTPIDPIRVTMLNRT